MVGPVGTWSEGESRLASRSAHVEPPAPAAKPKTGPLGAAASFFSTLRDESRNRSCTCESKTTREADGRRTRSHDVLLPKPTPGEQVLRPGRAPTFAGIRSDKLFDKLNFLSLMLALFCGTASLPHILIRYYTVKDEAAARKSTIVGIACIGFFYVLTLYMGLGAMTSGALDPDGQQHGRAAAWRGASASCCSRSFRRSPSRRCSAR